MNCILCVCVCVWLVSVSDGDCLLSLPRPLWHRGSSRGSGPGLTITQPPLYTVLYCTVQYTHIAYHYVPSLLQVDGWHKENSMGYVEMSSLPRPPLSSWPVSGDGAGGRGDIDIEGDDVSPLHYIEDIELQYTEVPHLRCSDKD